MPIDCDRKLERVDGVQPQSITEKRHVITDVDRPNVLEHE
jgi:hypothetical protein